MTERFTPPPPASSSISPRDLARAALRDLVALATQCATAEAQIEEQHRTGVEQAQQRLESTTKQIETRYRALTEQLNQRHEASRAQLAAKFAQDMESLKGAERAARARIDGELAAVQQNLKQTLDQAVWLAESVCDGTQAKIRTDLKMAKDLQGSHSEVIEKIESDAKSLLRKYSYRPTAADVPDPADAQPVGDRPGEAFAAFSEEATQRLEILRRLRVPRMLTGLWPYLLGLLLCIAGAAAGQAAAFFASRGVIALTDPQWEPIALGAGAGLAAMGLTALLLRIVGRSQIRRALRPLYQASDDARRAADAELQLTAREQEALYNQAIARRNAEVKAARDESAPMLVRATKAREAAVQNVQADMARRLPALEAEHQRATAAEEQSYRRHGAELESRYRRSLDEARHQHEQAMADSKRRYEQATQSLRTRLSEGLRQAQSPLETSAAAAACSQDWSDPVWRNWTPPRTFVSTVRIGQIEVDLRKIADSVPRQDQLKLQLPPPFAMPATLGFPRQASLLIQTDREGRDEAIRTVQMVMTRLLTTLPPGRVRFTLFDPVGLGQNFAGFMHLADHDEALVGGRIWTEAEHIDQRLADLTEHMETVIQKYLRNEFETIDDYNAQAGELAEPYRFLVIADFPVSCEGDVYRRLAAIASSGARCGVYTLVMRDLRQSLPSDAHMDELIASSVNLVRENGRFMWKDEVFGQFPLTLDRPPEEEFLTRLLDSVGRFAKEAKRVEVPFETITPKGEEFWSGQATDDLRVPIGKTGATRLQSLRLGRGVAQHSLIAGKTGSGKSTLLHVLITNMALWYSPDEVEFYLVDFKKGVEFKTYATHNLPHARAIAVESDREFGLSVLQRLDAELSRRGAFYRDLGVQDLAAYRAARVQAGDGKYPTLPRTLLIIDEFQEFFTEDDKLAQDAGLLIDRLVRQGRAFGVHVLLGSQTIGGSSGLARSTLGQMAVRVALQCSEADSQMILGDSNGAARLLSRPGEAIYNDAGGLVENNSPFQVAWLPDDSRDVYLDRIVARIAAMPPQQRPRVRGTIVFEGNAPADITKNERLTALLAAARPAATQSPVAYLGEPVAIKEPTSVTFQRQSGANVLLVGQHDEAARAIFTSALISLAAQHKPGDAEFVVLDGTPADQPHADYLARVKAALPQALTLVEYRAVPDAMARIAAEVKRRQEADEHTAPGLYLCIFGLQRYRALRKTEESFSFSASSEEKPSPAADKLLADVLRDGPSLGVHTIVWVDTPASLDRTMDRASMREFDHRVLFQMSATDSSNLIDSPAANKLGFYRALAYSEEQGVVEKFRPYALPGEEFLNHVRQRLGAMER